MVLEACRIGVTIGQSRLLDDVSLTVVPGEVVAIVGPNGAGKSTLLRVLCGDLCPTTGEVVLLGRALQAWPVREQARLRAVLPQQSTLMFAFTAREVVLLGRAPHAGGPRDEAIAGAALATVGIGHLSDRWYTSLSGGEQQRVQLARVLAQIWEPVDALPRALLLDEPTNSLDLTHQHHTLALARQWARQGVAVVAVLHDLNLAAQYADRIVLMHAGRIAAAGPPDAVLTTEGIEAVFGLPVQVTRHPALPGPLVIVVPQQVLEIPGG